MGLLLNFEDIEDGNLSKYLLLLANNHGLPTIPMVDYEVVAGDDFSRWCGSFGKAEVKEYIEVEMYGDTEEFVYRNDTEKYEDYLESVNGWNDDIIKEYLKSVKWRKAIFLNIDLP